MEIVNIVNSIEIKNLGFTYGEGWVFRNLTVTVPRGDFLAVIGANGAGKSTLLRIIARILEPSEGTVLLYGEPVKLFKDWGRIGYVPQNPARQQRDISANPDSSQPAPGDSQYIFLRAPNPGKCKKTGLGDSYPPCLEIVVT